MKMESFELLPGTKQALGRFFGCDPARVALVPNFSLGFNLLLEGLAPQSSVLLLENEYPSVDWPFGSHGFTVHRVTADEHLESRILEYLRKHRVDVLALSLVQWVNGITVSPVFLSQLKKEYPQLLILADGTQYCGALALDFQASGIDVLGASGYKWLLGGYGNAFFLFREGVEAHIRPRATGFNATGGDLSGAPKIPLPKHLEPGHLDSFNFGSLKYALEQLMGIGMDAVEAHNRQLSAYFREGLEAMGLLETAVLKRREHGTIFNLRGGEALYDYLEGHKVICSRRGGGVRLGFHLYNSMEDVSRVLELLKWRPL